MAKASLEFCKRGPSLNYYFKTGAKRAKRRDSNEQKVSKVRIKPK